MPRNPLPWLTVAAAFALVASGCGGSSSGSSSAGQASQAGTSPKTKLAASELKLSVPAVSGEALVGGSRLQLIGGLDSSGVSVDTVSELDPASGHLTQVGTLAAPLHDLAAARVGNATYVFGGGASTSTDTVQRLVPGGTAQVVGHLPTPASDLSALALNGKAYVLGGYDGQTTVGGVLETSDGVHLRSVATLPVPVRYTAAAALGGKIYAFGGELATGADSDAIQSIDPSSGTARVIGHLPQTLAHSSALVMGGRIFLLGGRAAGVASSQILAYDPASGRVTPGGKLPMPVTNSAAAVSGSAGYLVAGLGSATTALPTVIKLR